MKRTFTMIVEITHDRKGRYFGASFPELPGCYTMADTLRGLRVNAKEAIRLHVDGLRRTGQPIGEAAVRIDRIAVSMPGPARIKKTTRRAVAAQTSQLTKTVRLE